jgi:hypothetical protein
MAAIIEYGDVFEHNSISTSLSSLPMPMLSSLVKVDVHAICSPSLQKTFSISLDSHNLKNAELHLRLYYLP